MEKVKVTNTVNNKVVVQVKDINFSRTWPTLGSQVSIDKDKLEELMNDVGFMNMLKSGILYIEDMNVKKEFGLEPEDAKEPTNIIVLTSKEKKYYLTELSLVGFKEKIKKLSMDQLYELCEFAVENKLLDVDKSQVLKEACGRDILKASTLRMQSQEA